MSAPGPAGASPADGTGLARHGDAVGADPERTAAARRLVRAGGPDPVLQRLVGFVARLLDAPEARVVVLAAEAHVVTAVGPGAGGTGPLDEEMCTVAAEGGAPLVIRDATADDRVAGFPAVRAGRVVSYLGVPLVTGDGITVGALCVSGPTARDWSAGDVEQLGELAVGVLSALESAALVADLETRQVRWALAIEAAGIGAFDLDLTTGRVVRDGTLATMFGYDPADPVSSLATDLARVHPDDLPVLEAAIAAAVETCGEYNAEYRVLPPGATERRLVVRGRARPGPDGRAVQITGIAWDVTETREASDRAAHLLATMATAVVAVDASWEVTYLNASGERVLGQAADTLVGRSLWDAFPGVDEVAFAPILRTALERGEPTEFEAYHPGLDGWFELQAVPDTDGLKLYIVDITARHHAQARAEAAQAEAEAARRRAEESAARLQLLATVSTELAATLDVERTMARLAQLVVPALADWSTVTLIDAFGGVRDVGWWHADPDQRGATRRYAAALLDHPGAVVALRGPARGAAPVVHPEAAAATAAAALRAPSARAAMLALAPTSSASFALTARGHVHGYLDLYRGGDRPAMSESALGVAAQVAARAALALDNARLYSEQRGLAEALQRSLLTDPPEPADCEIAVRYEPAAEAASVGGDWFDSFLLAEGATVIAIGDVVGHNIEAAAAMGQLRGLLRGIAWTTGAGPAAVLGRLDAAIAGLALDTTATAVVACLEPAGGTAVGAGRRVLSWSNAGHPPPVMVDPSGRTTVLDHGAADLLLGIDAGTDRRESLVVLDPGATVVLYTDGLVERRGENLEVGIARLRTTLADTAGLTVEELCDRVLDRMLPGRADDDVALLALRVRVRPA